MSRPRLSACLMLALSAHAAAWAAPSIDGAARTQTVQTLAERMAWHYVDAGTGREAARVLRQRLASGAYDRLDDARQFAQRLSEDLQELTHDRHAEVVYMEEALEPDRPQEQIVDPGRDDFEAWARRRDGMLRAAKARQFGFPDSRRLAGDVAYVRIDEFPEPFLAASTVAAEMAAVAGAPALILDLRANGGGNPDTVTQLCAYLFDDRPVHLNDQLTRGIGRVLPVWTQPVASDLRFGSRKPLFILVGKETFSAAENLAYTLQALKRAVIVGAPTRGGAHGGRGFRLSEHFLASVPNRQTVNAVTHADWEGTGVQPDVRVEEAQALATAQRLAASALRLR